MNRRQFLYAGTTVTAAAFTSHAHSHHHGDEAPYEAAANQPPPPKHPVVSGSGEFHYQYEPDKLVLPPGVSMRNGHGLCLDTQGNIYFTFEPEQVDEHTRCLVRFGPDGTGAELLGPNNSLAHGTPHGLNIHVDKGGKAALYHANNDATVHKTTLDGQILWTQRWPPQMGNYKPTDAVVPPAGDCVVVADGYGSSMLHMLKAADGVYAGRSWGGLGSAHGELNCPHGITYDQRRQLLLTADRGNKRLEYFTVNGFYHSTIEAKEITAPCNADIRGDHVLVPDLNGPLVILDKDNQVVSVIEVGKLLGDQGFRHPHDAIWLANGDIAACTWNPGRLGYWRRIG
jgi:hypothetical protein